MGTRRLRSLSKRRANFIHSFNKQHLFMEETPIPALIPSASWGLQGSSGPNSGKVGMGNSLAVQWLGLCALTAEGPGLIPGWGTKIPQGARCSQKKKKRRVVLKEVRSFGCPPSGIYWEGGNDTAGQQHQSSEGSRPLGHIPVALMGLPTRWSRAVQRCPFCLAGGM